MNCSKCGSVLAPGSTICSVCGTPVGGMQPTNVSSQSTVQTSPVQPTPASAPVMPVNPTPVSPVNPAPVQPMSNMNGQMNYGMPNAQPMPGQMPNMYQNMQGPMQEPKKSKGALYAVIGILLAAAIGAAVYFLFFNGDKENGGGSETPGGNTPTNPSGGDNTGDNTSTEKKVTIGDYSYVLPSGYTYSKSNDYDVLSNVSDSITAILVTFNSSYNVVTLYKDQIEEEYTSSGYDVKSINEETYDGREWLVVTYDADTGSGQMVECKDVYTTLDFSSTIEFGIVNKGTKTFNSILSDLGKMVDSAEYIGASGFTADDAEEYKSSVIDWNSQE